MSFLAFCLSIIVPCLAGFMLKSNYTGLNAGSWHQFSLESNSKASGLPSQPGKVGLPGPSTNISGRACLLREFAVDLTDFLRAKEMQRDFQWILHNLIFTMSIAKAEQSSSSQMLCKITRHF